MQIDLILFLALGLDLFFKYRRYKKVKLAMPNWKRYQYNTTKLKYVLYVVILVLSGLFLGYRLWHINTWKYAEITMFIPLIDYYVLWDLFFHGIYYNNRAIYYKSELYEFHRAAHIYRDLVKDHYEYDMIYRMPEGGTREVIIKIPNEKEAYPLLSVIPFEEA